MAKVNFDSNSKELFSSYQEALKNNEFKKLVKRLKINDDLAMKYTSKLENTVWELKNCKNCKGLVFCKNKVEGHVDYPILRNGKLVFNLIPCKYQQEVSLKDRSKENICIKDITLDDKRRLPVIKWIKEFLTKLENNEKLKGLYLHGNFGCGKTFILKALFNELAKRRSTCEVVYFPELLRDLKSDFDDFGSKMEYLMEVDFLLLDDIGAEKVTEWGRDEILGTILQYRMNNKKVTFFTSNLDINELEIHLANSGSSVDGVKARRIIERIKCLTDDMELIGENKRV